MGWMFTLPIVQPLLRPPPWDGQRQSAWQPRSREAEQERWAGLPDSAERTTQCLLGGYFTSPGPGSGRVLPSV